MISVNLFYWSMFCYTHCLKNFWTGSWWCSFWLTVHMLTHTGWSKKRHKVYGS